MQIELDLSKIGLSPGYHNIGVKLSDNGETHLDSEMSNILAYTQFHKLDKPVVSLVGSVIKWDTIQYADDYLIYVNGTQRYTTTENSFDLSVLSPGTYEITVQATARKIYFIGSYASNKVTYEVTAQKLNHCSAEFDSTISNMVIITPDDGSGVATMFTMYDNGTTTGVVIPRQA